MPKPILIPLDGSELAERALPFAQRIARASRTKMLLYQAAPAAQNKDAYPYLERVCDRFKISSGEVVRLADYIPSWGDAASAILKAARDKQVDLIAMSTHGRGGVGRLLRGSVADAVLRQATVPVLLVPVSCAQTWATDRPLRLLVPLDGSSFAEQALGPAAELAETLGAELHLLRAFEPVSTGQREQDVQGGTTLAEVAARQDLERVASGLRAAKTAVSVHAAEGAAAETIARVTREQGIDLIAMSTHGRGGLARVMLGSVATEALRHVDVPLLLVRPAGLHESIAELGWTPVPMTAT